MNKVKFGYDEQFKCDIVNIMMDYHDVLTDVDKMLKIDDERYEGAVIANYCYKGIDEYLMEDVGKAISDWLDRVEEHGGGHIPRKGV